MSNQEKSTQERATTNSNEHVYQVHNVSKGDYATLLLRAPYGYIRHAFLLCAKRKRMNVAHNYCLLGVNKG